MRIKFFQILLAGLVATIGSIANSQEKPAVDEREPDRKAIQANVKSYVAAFNQKDVEKLVAHWTEDGAYTNRTTGDKVLGRAAIAKEFKATFAEKDVPKLAVETEAIEFISPNVALETGVATVTFDENNVVETRYRVVFVKKEKQWLIDRVTENEIEYEISHYENLQPLEWLIGDWVDEVDDGFRIEIACSWTKKQNFISRTYTTYRDGEVESSGLQVIGWDANQEKIRSWLFDSEGGVVTGTWVQRKDRWVVQSVATLADGSKGSFTSIFRPLDDGNYGWQKINQVVEGKLLPNVDETIVQKK